MVSCRLTTRGSDWQNCPGPRGRSKSERQSRGLGRGWYVGERIPPVLRRLWAFWTDYTQIVAQYQSWIWLGLVYYLVIGPTSLVMFALRKPLLPSSFGRGGSHW